VNIQEKDDAVKHVSYYNESNFWFGFRKIHKKGGTPLCY
jgi:hypothetical protein